MDLNRLELIALYCWILNEGQWGDFDEEEIPIRRQYPETEEDQLGRIKLFFETEFARPEWSSRDVGRKWFIRKAETSYDSDEALRLCPGSKTDLGRIIEEEQEEMDLESGTVGRSNSKRTGKLRGTKVHIRHLPKSLSEVELLEVLDPLPPYDYIHFLSGKFLSTTMNQHMTGSCYISFSSFEDANRFVQEYAYFVLINERGQEFRATCQFAINQKIHKSSSKDVQAKLYDFEFDEDFIVFRDSYIRAGSGPVESYIKTSPEVMLKEIEDRKRKFKELQLSPLIKFVMSQTEEHMIDADTVRELKDSPTGPAKVNAQKACTSPMPALAGGAAISEPVGIFGQENGAAIQSVRLLSPKYDANCVKGDVRQMQTTSRSAVLKPSARHEDLKKFKFNFQLAPFGCIETRKDADTSEQQTQKDVNDSDHEDIDFQLIQLNKKNDTKDIVPPQTEVKAVVARNVTRTRNSSNVKAKNAKTDSSNYSPSTNTLLSSSQQIQLSHTSGDRRPEKLPQSITGKPKPRALLEIKLPDMKLEVMKNRSKSKTLTSRQQNKVPDIAASNSIYNASRNITTGDVKSTNTMSSLPQNRISKSNCLSLIAQPELDLAVSKTPENQSQPKQMSSGSLSEARISQASMSTTPTINTPQQPQRRKSRVFFSTAKQKQRLESTKSHSENNNTNNFPEVKLRSTKSKSFPKLPRTDLDRYEHSTKTDVASESAKYKKSSIYRRSQIKSNSFSSSSKDIMQKPKPLLSLVIPPPRIFSRNSISVSEITTDFCEPAVKSTKQPEKTASTTESIIKTVHSNMYNINPQSPQNPGPQDRKNSSSDSRSQNKRWLKPRLVFRGGNGRFSDSG
ncbi:unnamed protein product [Allacma fusca]|uniref:UPF3 domain-containing protein n=1 Tax=Allacma fusca TaxID=39272 RepID=A0A8J2MF73_9HEXA|nr:unnamed protein product [Allacma fusca]